MAVKEKMAIANATIGNTGYMGTLKGLSKLGSFFLSCSRDIMDMIYNVSAPKTEIVIMIAVLPDINAMMPITIFPSKA